MDDKSALKALRKSDESALEWVIEKYSPYVGTVIWNVLGDRFSPCEHEEVAADTFMALWRNSKKIHSENLKSYLGAIARNRALSRLQSTRIEIPLEKDILDVTCDDPADLLQQKELHSILNTAVLDMTEPDREIFLRHYYYCQKVSQIALEMGINESTIKTKLRRGRLALAKYLKKRGYYLENQNI